MKKILLLSAHPDLRASSVNAALFEAARRFEAVTAVDLAAEYPDFQIDVTREQARLRAHDVLIFLFPLHWYSTPALLRQWQDQVLSYGFAYGSGGDALKGKLLFCALSSGSPAGCFSAGKTLDALLSPLRAMAADVGLTWQQPFVLHGARTAAEEGRLAAHLHVWQQVLAHLHGVAAPAC